MLIILVLNNKRMAQRVLPVAENRLAGEPGGRGSGWATPPTTYFPDWLMADLSSNNILHLLKPEAELLAAGVDDKLTIFGNTVYFTFKNVFSAFKLVGLLVAV